VTAVASFGHARLVATGGSFAACPPVNHIEASSLFQQANGDIRGLLINADLSLLDALGGARAGLYSWATVKLYYSLFYSIKALLLIRRRGLFYFNQKPGLVEIWPGGTVRKLTTAEGRGGGHGSAIRLFAAAAPNHVLLTPVGSFPSLEWMKSLREEVNYNLPRFVEPGVPDWFLKSVAIYPLRKVIASYTASPLLYAFDPDHAALALPLLAARSATEESTALGVTIDDDDRAALTKYAKDENGTLAQLVAFLYLTA